MEYLSLSISIIIGILGAGIGYILLSKVSQDKIFLSITTIAVGFISYLVIQPIIYDKYFKELALKSQLNELLQEVERSHSPLLPRIADVGIRQESIKASDLRLTFGYTILDPNIDQVTFEKTFTERAKDVKEDACFDSGYRRLTANGVTFEYVYRLESSTKTKSFEVQSCD